MNSKLILGAVPLLPLIVSGSPSSAQANIMENQSASIYVNGQAGSDLNAGISAQPMQTIQAAVNKAIAAAQAGVGTKVIIAPGTYRENVSISNASNAPITIQAATPGSVILDGADVLTGGYESSANVYSYSWKDTVSGCGLPSGWYTGMPPVVLANEMVFVNGAPLTQVMSASQLRPGTFFVNSGSDQILISAASGTNISQANVEVANRRSVLSINGAHNLVFRGLTFQHAAACMNQTGATVSGSSNILFDNDTAKWNNWGGLGVDHSTNVTVENSTGSYNGGSGLSGFQNTNSAWENNETDYNNWRGAMVGLYDFANGGVKLMHAHTAKISGQRSFNNASQGLWFDTDNMNITISGATLVGNLVGNLQLEASQGPVSVSNSTLCSGGGLQLINTGGVTLTGNVFYNNGGQSFQDGQVFLAGNPGGREVTNWQTGATTLVYTKDTTLEGNSFVAVGSNQNVFNTYLNGKDWSEFIDSITSNNNHWYNASKTSAFGLPSSNYTTLAGWRSVSKQDRSSVWGAGSTGGCGVPGPSYPDFQVLAHNAATYVSGYSMSGGRINIPVQVRSFSYGAVQLSASGMPSGVTASFSNASLSSGSSVLTLRASSSARSQTALITIFGVSGSRVHALTLKVAVRP